MWFKVYKNTSGQFSYSSGVIWYSNTIQLKICQYFSEEIMKQLFSGTDLLYLRLLKSEHYCPLMTWG